MMWSSGIGSYIRNLVPRVIQSRPDTRFYLLGRPQEMGRWKGFARGPRIEWIEMTSEIFTLAEQFELSRKIPKATDLFWSPNYNFPLLYRGKLMVTVHDVFHLANPRFVRGIHRKLYARSMFNRLVRRADAILCVSRFTRQELLRLAGGDGRKMFVVHNGVDEAWFKGARKKSPRTQPYLLFVGNVKPHKNLGRLLEAFDLLKGRIPHNLIIVGKKDGFITGDKEVVRRAERFGKRVQFTGVLSDEKLRGIYAAADLLVFPSLYEGFGLPPLEAMACGTPVACSRAASLPEVCGNAVQYFDPQDSEDIAKKVLKLIKDEKRKKDLKSKGLKRVKVFSWDKCAIETCGFIHKLLL